MDFGYKRPGYDLVLGYDEDTQCVHVELSVKRQWMPLEEFAALVEEFMNEARGEQEEPRKSKAPLERFYNGHQLSVSQDGFCNIKCRRCGLESRTYLSVFEERCAKEPPQVKYA